MKSFCAFPPLPTPLHPQVYPPEVTTSSHLPRTPHSPGLFTAMTLAPRKKRRSAVWKTGKRHRGGLRLPCPLFLFLLIILLAISSFQVVIHTTQNIVLSYFNSLIYGFRTVSLASLLWKMRNTACWPKRVCFSPFTPINLLLVFYF